MEVKKSKKAEIETKRSTWLLMGFVTVLACMFIAFEWTQRDVNVDLSQRLRDPVFIEELVPITFPAEKPLPPPPAAPKQAEELIIAKNEANVQETNVAGTEADNVGVVVKKIEIPTEDITEPDLGFVVIAEEMPSFPGGQGALMQFMNKTIKYPTVPQENGVQGRVIIQFIVDKDGSIIDPVIVKSIDPYLDKEALRVIKAMPKWTPGMQRGKAVRVKYTVPVIFRLQ